MTIDNLTIGEARQIAALFGSAQPTTTQDHDERPVLVWTDHRGVIFGYTSNVHARPITLKRARMCLYWSKDVGGVFGLCDVGPTNGCRVSAALPEATFEGVTGVASLTDGAVAAWLSAPVQGR
jgi:hypothetical protein